MQSAAMVAKRVSRHENGILVIVLIAIVAAFAVVTRGATLTYSNVRNVILQSSIRGIASVGQLFVILTAGIDLAVGGVALFCLILGASIMNGQTHIPVQAIVAIFAVGLGLGSANGSLVSRIGMPALVVTLGMWQIVNGGSFMISKGVTFLDIPKGLAFFGSGFVGGVPVPIIIFVAVAAVAYFVLHYTPFGRAVYSVGGNPVSAWLSGIEVKNVTFAVYAISGLLAGLAGFVTLARIMSGGMNSIAGLELDSIAAVVVGGVSLAGGRGSLIGAVIGVIILGVINNAMNVLVLDPAAQDIVKGAIIIIAVAIDYLRRR